MAIIRIIVLGYEVDKRWTANNIFMLITSLCYSYELSYIIYTLTECYNKVKCRLNPRFVQEFTIFQRDSIKSSLHTDIALYNRLEGLLILIWRG